MLISFGKPTNSAMNKSKLKTILALHILLLVFSLSNVCSKLAAGEEFLSFRFCLCYGGIILILGIYAICWQQIIKRLPLTTAYANRAITIVWGIVWGMFFFREQITAGKIVGALIVIAGVILYVTTEDESETEDSPVSEMEDKNEQ